MTDRGPAETLLDERPELRDALATLLAVDEEHDAWTFDDVDLDSGTFGELVSRAVVEDVGDEYRLADPAAVRAALGDDAGTETRDEEADPAGRTTPSLVTSLPTSRPSAGAVPTTPASLRTWSVRHSTVIAAALALALVVAVRLFSLSAVYRDGHVVLSGNDPYYYRQMVELYLANGGAALLPDPAAVPAGISSGEPLLVTALGWVSALLGGTEAAVGHVLALYPVVAAVAIAVFVYSLARRTTGDARVAVGAVLFLALLPGFVMRTSLGFADHHAFDYVFLVATSLGLHALVTRDRGASTDRRTVALTALLGLAIAAQVLAWQAGPLLLVPFGVVLLAETARAVGPEETGLTHLGAPLAALTLATLVAGSVHLVFDWQRQITVLAPLLLAIATGSAMLAARVVRKRTNRLDHLAGVWVGTVLLGVVAVAVVPGGIDALSSGIERLLGDPGAVEAASLLGTTHLGGVLQLGVLHLVVLPGMVIGIQRARQSRRFTTVTAYAWYFLGLAVIQARFVGEFSPFAAVFAAVGFVALADWVDLARPLDAAVATIRVPEPRTLGSLFVLFVLVAGLGAAQVPIQTNKVTIEDGTYRTATHLASVAATADEPASDQYVLSHWGRNRVYNHFVSGDSASYGYARDEYGQLARSTTPDERYRAIEQRVDYVVVRDSDARAAALGTFAFGLRGDPSPELGHYRLLYVPPSRDRYALELVPGAVVRGTAPAGTTVSLLTGVSVPGANATYERTTTAAANGTWAVRVSHAGGYSILGDTDAGSVTVPERAVRRGGTVDA